MCKKASLVITQRGEIGHNVHTDSHEDIIKAMKLKDNTPAEEATFARVEIVPPGEDYSLPISKWVFRLDEDRTPDWWNEGYKKLCYDYLKTTYMAKQEVKTYHSNGKPDVICTYRNGQYHGKYEVFYFNGKPCVICTYRNGQLEGKYEAFYDNGKPKAICTYRNGQLEGKYERFYDNGKSRVICTYHNGQRI